MLEELNQQVLNQVGTSDHVLGGLSGGVDSSVVAVLLTKILGRDRVHCVFVNNGLLRKNEYQDVMKSYDHLGLNVTGVDASAKFLGGLKTLIEPELKRKAIGRIFIEVFEESVQKIKQQTKTEIKWLAQGTLYPDVIESVSTTGSSVTIKSHHNVGGLPEKLNFKLLEPVRLLFKDEVRRLGRELPADGWRALLSDAGASGFDVVLPHGADAEETESRALATGLERALVPPRLPLAAMAALLARAHAVVGIDTGLTHLSAALGTPTLALFTTTDPALAGTSIAGAHARDLGGRGVMPGIDEARAALGGILRAAPRC